MPLGLEDRRVPEGHLSASTYHSSSYSPIYGRLNGYYSWGARSNRAGEWFQVNFVELTTVKGVATQGRYNADYWVKKYTVGYSVNGMNYIPYKENGRVRVRKCCCSQNNLMQAQV